MLTLKIIFGYMWYGFVMAFSTKVLVRIDWVRYLQRTSPIYPENGTKAPLYNPIKTKRLQSRRILFWKCGIYEIADIKFEIPWHLSFNIFWRVSARLLNKLHNILAFMIFKVSWSTISAYIFFNYSFSVEGRLPTITLVNWSQDTHIHHLARQQLQQV